MGRLKKEMNYGFVALVRHSVSRKSTQNKSGKEGENEFLRIADDAYTLLT